MTSERLVALLRREVLNAGPNAELPTIRDVAHAIGKDCPIGTVQRAYAMLEDEGLVVNRGQRGRWTAANLPTIRLQPAIALLRDAIQQLCESGYSEQDLTNAWREARQGKSS